MRETTNNIALVVVALNMVIVKKGVEIMGAQKHYVFATRSVLLNCPGSLREILEPSGLK